MAATSIWDRVLAGEVIECKAWDHEERKWLHTTLRCNDKGAVEAEDEEGLVWSPSQEELADHNQFRFN